MNREELMDLFSEKIRELLARLPVDYEEVQEIRLRAEKPLLIRYGTREYFVTEDGKLSEEESEGTHGDHGIHRQLFDVCL